LEIITGCSGWSYTSWQGPFYPDNLENRNWLSYYSNIIDYVEIVTGFRPSIPILANPVTMNIRPKERTRQNKHTSLIL
jgi:hypothetical protein